jgi:hypothetical protein
MTEDSIEDKFKKALGQVPLNKAASVDRARLMMIEQILRSRSCAVVGSNATLANVDPLDLDKLLHGCRKLLADLELAKSVKEKPNG